MTRPALRAQARQRDDSWADVVPELTIAAVLVVTLSIAAWAWAGMPATMVVLVGAAVLALALMRLLPAPDIRPEEPADEWREPGSTTIAGFWRRRSMVKGATASMGAFEAELRPTLQHLLAARLSERHGISLHDDPEAARRLVLAGGRDNKLWYWLDPQRPPSPGNSPGIPPRTLAAIIHRLEEL